jgi:uncharacterized protein (DUF1697 family)
VLLRGINVGGNNIIKMNVLKELFEKTGFTDVITYIQSGNIIFKDSETNKTKVAGKIEKMLFEKLDSKITIAILTADEMIEIINKKPYKFGEEDEKHKYDVLFLIEPLTVKEAIKEIKIREGVDELFEGNKVLYFKRLKEKITKTYLTKIIGTPIYKYITIRNWNTTNKLYELMCK